VFLKRITLHVPHEFVPDKKKPEESIPEKFLSLKAFTDRIGYHNAALLRQVDTLFPKTIERPDGDLEIKASCLEFFVAFRQDVLD
jgi:hypothetical protein